MLYLLSCLIAIACACIVDYVLKTKVISSPYFAKGIAIALIAQLLFDNYFVDRGLWVFSPQAILGWKLPFLPLENLLFGIALWLSTIVAWEYLLCNRAIRD